MIRIGMAGACGRMGQRILAMAARAEDLTIGAALEAPGCEAAELAVDGETVAVTTDPAAAAANCDVLIDFTLAESCPGNVEAAAQAGTPCVVGTTGLGDDAVAVLRRCAETIPVVYAPNMSVGVNLLFKLTQQVAAALGLDYNIEISEIHHNKKKDSPSGTAVRLAECAAEGLGLDAKGDVIYGRQGAVGERPVREIGVHALRGGDIAGEHTVVFAGQGERLELAHKAHSRDNFAQGALTAARFAVNAAPGLYDMQDVLGLR